MSANNRLENHGYHGKSDEKNRVLEWGELTKLLGPVVFSFSTS